MSIVRQSLVEILQKVVGGGRWGLLPQMPGFGVTEIFGISWFEM
jgi:hypothetical protein